LPYAGAECYAFEKRTKRCDPPQGGAMPADTLIGIFLDAVSTHRKPDLFQRKTPQGWESIGAERALGEVESLALALRELGVSRGDRVVLLSENRVEWPFTDLAVLGLGAITVPIYPSLTAAQIRYMVDDSEPRVAVVSTQEQLDKVRAATRERPIPIVHMDPLPAFPGGHAMAALVERGRAIREREPQAFRESAGSVRPDDVATIIYTSGTTGEPKGAMLTHRNIAFDVGACLQFVDLGPGDLCLSFLPLCHVFERMAGLYAHLACGASIAYAESMDTVAANAAEVRPTILCGVPRFYEKVYARVMDNARKERPLRRAIFHWGLEAGLRKARAHFERRSLPPFAALAAMIGDRLVGARIRERIGGRVRLCISGGAPLPPKVLEFFFAIGVRVLEGYGLTETSPVITLNPPGREKSGSVGPPIPGVEVRIDGNGEILTRGPNVMLGYYRNEPATREALRDGWFHTGDIGHLDADGYLVITDRLKDLLVTAGGKKVAPQPLEARLKTSKWVSEAVLLGDQRPYVVALIVPNFANLDAEARERGWPHKSVDELIANPAVHALYQSLIDQINSELARFEQVKKFALMDHELTQDSGELTPTLKVKRRVVMERYASLIEGLYGAQASAAG
jgi:long-chain acyl-CoA synthetase